MGKTEAIDLTFCQTNDLINELQKRHDSLVITGIKFLNVNGQYMVTNHKNGHRHVCLGLMDIMRDVIVEEERKSLIPTDG